MHKTPLGFCYGLIALLAGCTSILNPKLDSKPENIPPQYWLKSSLYGGNFYDDNQITLVDCKPFSAISDASTIDGFNLYPPAPNHIIPAGTLVQIEAISYPTGMEKFKRPIYSPRDSIWVYLKVAKERGQVNLFRDKPHVMVIPKNITTEEALKTYLKNYLSLKDPNKWIVKEASFIQEAIWHKRPVIGMNKAQVQAALGPPLKKQFTKEPDEKDQQELWHYDDYFIALKGERVNKVRNLKKLDN